jgi:hypothetical protein
LLEQQAKCAICGCPEAGRINTRRLFVDHCHKTQKVRGLLCYRCNTLLGLASDDPNRLRRAVEYLERQVSDSSI